MAAPHRHALGRAGKVIAAAEPTYLVLALILFWSLDGGGFDRLTWYRGTLVVFALAVATQLATGRRSSPAPQVRLAVLTLVAFTAWSYISVSWAGVRSDALDAANQTLLYLLVFWIFVGRDWTLAGAVRHLYALACGVAVVGLVSIEQTRHAAVPAAALLRDRLADPTGYPNATAALFLLPVWPMIFLMTRREASVPGRAVAGATSSLLLCLSLIPQSRGEVFMLPAVVVLYLVAVPSRWRQLLALGVVGTAAFLAHSRLFAVYTAAREGGNLVGALAGARNASLLAAGGVALATTGWALLDRRLKPSHVFVHRANVAAAALLAAALAGALAATVTVGHPQRWAQSAWRDFKYNGEPEGTSRFGSLGSQRYDFWRVSLETFTRHPVGGIGAGNFEVPYTRDRHSDEEPTNPHSLEMQILLGTGAVGALLALVFVAASVLALGRSSPRKPGVRGVAFASAISFAYFLLHGSVDWLWEFPAIGGAAFALLGMSLGLAASRGEAPARAGRSPLRIAVASAAGLAACLAAVVLILPLLGETRTRAAIHSWRTDPAGALRLLRQARRLDFLNDEPDIVAGVVATQLGDVAGSRAAFARATTRDPYDWYAWLRLAAAESQLGHRAPATRDVARALELDPRESLVREAARKIAAGRAVAGSHIDQVMAARADAVLR